MNRNKQKPQGPVLFEDLAVYFSQEECASLHPAQRSLSREATQECFEDKALSAENDKIEINQLLHLESMGLEELALEKCSLAVPLIYYQEKCSEHGAGNFERKISGGISACKKRFRSLLVTIENHTPKIELAQSLRTRALPKILPFPKEETKKSYKCPECDQSFSDSSYLIWHQKTHVGKKKCECDDCRKIFNHRSNLRAHRRIHTGEKPYKCFSPVWSAAQCGSSFHQPSHLSQHRKTHLKEKIHRCGICEGGSRSSGDCHSIRKPILPQKPAINMSVRKQIWLCLRKSTGKPPSSCAAPAGIALGSPCIPAQERPQGQSERYSN